MSRVERIDGHTLPKAYTLTPSHHSMVSLWTEDYLSVCFTSNPYIDDRSIGHNKVVALSRAQVVGLRAT
ncbi:hypothetical protein FRX31_009671 [Thalictrum thalictroides]|uniref:Uncharacterized protein n=1 Tax=Thalictrum thalictroides TaxID=46969 RepID=A0A7J6WVZ8_THATH|nr:hypothetical protein FRX31_009671 [Thalictrum thalictroides]